MKYIDIVEKAKRKKRKKSIRYTGWGWIQPTSDAGGISEATIANPTIDDIRAVADWFHTTYDNLEINVVQEPITKFINQINMLYSTYGNFPKDSKRTKKIMKEIKNTDKLFPIYVENGDPSLFVMEGRHRMVAFMLLGFKEIPVAYVSKKT